MELEQQDLTRKILGVYYEVYNELGFGFLESVYESAMAEALANAGIDFERQKLVPVYFRDTKIAEFKLDLLVENSAVVEIKAASSLLAAHEAQLINYLKATRMKVGLLLNFGPTPEFRRRVF